MKNGKGVIMAGAILAAASGFLAPEPAMAVPTCEQEVSIRCSGYGVQGRPRLDIYYDSYEECVEAETFYRCGGPSPFASLNGRVEDLIAGQVKS